jgi:TonB-linked SusC/RagA family outer membrane protein
VNKTRLSLLTLALLTLSSTSLLAQTRRLSGRVTVEGTGEPVPSATVNVVGTTFGAITGSDGRFTLSAPQGPATIRVRRIGYQPKTMPVAAGLTDVTVAMKRDVLELDKQVITGTATTVASLNAANAVAVVSGAQVNRAPAQTIDNALQGKIAGAVITSNSGAPGGGTQVQLRGVSTVNAGFSPLYVVDGVIVNNSAISNGLNTLTEAARSSVGINATSNQDQQVNRIADINPNDIESIQVLKGPSASSIYGSQGTNGVIIINTKQGRVGRPALEVTQRLGTYVLANKLGPFRCFQSAEEVAQSFGATSPLVAAYNASDKKCHDFEEEMYGNNSLAYQTVASLRGATDAGTNYFISGLAQRDNGLALNDQYRKQSLRINVGQRFGQRLNVRANTEILHSLTERGISGNDNSGIAPYDAFAQTPTFVDFTRQPDGTYLRNPQNGVRNSNPLQNQDRIKTPENVYRLIGGLTGIYNLLASEKQTLDLTLGGGIDAYNDNSRIISPADIYVEQANGNPGTLVNNNANILNAGMSGTLAHRLITNVFNATTSGGFRQGRRQSDIVNNIGRGVFPGVTAVSAAVQTFVNEEQNIVKDFSLFLQEEFLTLNERLLLTGGVNFERTSNNGDPSKFYNYPKYSASYRVPEIIPKISDLKLRLAYGKAGNQPTAGKFTFLTTLFNEGRTGLRASTVKGLSSIKPETATELEGGFDLTAFDGRLRLSATQYRKQIDDLLLQASIAPSTGFTTQWINGGQIVNKGTEIELSVTPIQMRNFEWLSQTTFARNRGKVTELPVPGFIAGPGSFGLGSGFIEKGQSPSVIQGPGGCSITLTGRTAATPFGQRCPSANRLLAFVGDAAPDFTMGFSNDVKIGAVKLSALLDWRKGGDIVNLTNNYFDGGLIGFGGLWPVSDTAVTNERYTQYRAQNPVYIEDAGFVKLRELTLSYDLPNALVQRLFNGKAQNARIEFSGRNLKTWTDYTGLDPEVSNNGNGATGRIQDITPYPPSRGYFFSIHTTF